jgi:hypothetical protein
LNLIDNPKSFYTFQDILLTVNKIIILYTITYILFFDISFYFDLFNPVITIFVFILSILFVISFLLYVHRKIFVRILTKFTNFRILFLLTFLLFFSLQLYQSFTIAPNVADAANYHLPRVFHWIQNENFSAFFTSNYRENFYYTLPDILYIPLIISNNLNLIGTINAFYNFFSIFNMMGIVILFMMKFKNYTNVQHGSRINIILTISLILNPILLSNFSQTTDENFNLMIFSVVYFLIVYSNVYRKSYNMYLFLILVICINSKPTLLLVILPLYLYYTFLQIDKISISRIYTRSSLVKIILVSFVIFWNYFKLSGNFANIISSSNSLSTVVGLNSFNPATIIWNSSRIFLSLLQTPLDQINQNFLKIDNAASASILSVYEPRTFLDIPFSLSSSLHSDFVGSPLSILVFLIAVLNVIRLKKFKLFTLLIYPISIFFLLGSVFAWQPWINRFFGPFIFSLIPFIFLSLINAPRRFIIAIFGILLSSMIPWILWNPTRTIMPISIPYNIGSLVGVNKIYLKSLENDSNLNRDSQILRTSKISKLEFNLPIDILKADLSNRVVLNIGGDDNELIFWVNKCKLCSLEHFDKEKLYTDSLIISVTELSTYSQFLLNSNDSFYVYLT